MQLKPRHSPSYSFKCISREKWKDQGKVARTEQEAFKKTMLDPFPHFIHESNNKWVKKKENIKYSQEQGTKYIQTKSSQPNKRNKRS